MGEKSTFLQTEVNGSCEGVDKCGLAIVSSIVFDAMVRRSCAWAKVPRKRPLMLIPRDLFSTSQTIEGL